LEETRWVPFFNQTKGIKVGGSYSPCLKSGF
jgi:hypothetical protein